MHSDPSFELEQLSRAAMLVDEVFRLRIGMPWIATARAQPLLAPRLSSGVSCPSRPTPCPTVPEWPQFLRGASPTASPSTTNSARPRDPHRVRRVRPQRASPATRAPGWSAMLAITDRATRRFGSYRHRRSSWSTTRVEACTSSYALTGARYRVNDRRVRPQHQGLGASVALDQQRFPHQGRTFAPTGAAGRAYVLDRVVLCGADRAIPTPRARRPRVRPTSPAPMQSPTPRQSWASPDQPYPSRTEGVDGRCGGQPDLPKRRPDTKRAQRSASGRFGVDAAHPPRRRDDAGSNAYNEAIKRSTRSSRDLNGSLQSTVRCA